MSKVLLPLASSWCFGLGSARSYPFCLLEKKVSLLLCGPGRKPLSPPVSVPHTASVVRWGQPPLRSLGTRMQWQSLRMGGGGQPDFSLSLRNFSCYGSWGKADVLQVLGGPDGCPSLTGARAFVPHKGKIKKLLNCIFHSPLPCVSEDESFSSPPAFPCSLPPFPTQSLDLGWNGCPAWLPGPLYKGCSQVPQQGRQAPSLACGLSGSGFLI